MNKLRWLALGCALALAPLARAEKVPVEGSKIEFDSEATDNIGGKDVALVITGTALREKAWFNVYGIASYVDKAAPMPKTAEEIASADIAKELRLIMDRGVGAKKMSNAFREAIENNYKAEDFPTELKAFEEYFEKAEEVKEKDPITFINVPGSGLVCKVAALPPLEIKNPKFAKAVWDIYFGQNNVGEGIKQGLSSRLPKS